MGNRVANTSSRLPGLTEPWLTTVLFANHLNTTVLFAHSTPPLASLLFVALGGHIPTPEPLRLLFPLSGLLFIQKPPQPTPFPLCPDVIFSVGPLSTTLPQNINPTNLDPPCLTPCLVYFSPESSDFLYHSLIYFVIYLLSSTEQGFLSAWLTSVSPA